MSHDSISRLWRRFGIQPWLCEMVKFSTDPELEAKARDVVELYLNRWMRSSPVRYEALMKPCGMRGPPPVIAVTGRSWRQIDPRVRVRSGAASTVEGRPGPTRRLVPASEEGKAKGNRTSGRKLHAK
jgi:hypothetical protein